jgi:SAM-dependent methyltransferase/uncharacterized protein YbaR (Trm112 family)
MEMIRCPACREKLQFVDSPDDEGRYYCTSCGEDFPIVEGIPCLVLSPLRKSLASNVTGAESIVLKTALSFGYEWNRFPEMYDEWQQSFLNYMQPHPPEFFRGKKALDAGCGSGRFAYYAARYGADVIALDLSSAINVARRNTRGLSNVQVVQADLHKPPFEYESFDFIYSIGVLHHLPDPEATFQTLLRYLKPGGEIQIYLYWKPEGQPLKRSMLAAVSAVRQITTRLPHSLVYMIAFPAAFVVFLLFVWPYRLLKKIPGLRNIAERLPMKQYSDFPFRVCVNDQLDRFSAPIENRYKRVDVESWLQRAGLQQPQVFQNFGWVATGRKPT